MPNVETVILVDYITQPEPDSDGYATAQVAEDESEPEWAEVEFIAAIVGSTRKVPAKRLAYLAATAFLDRPLRVLSHDVTAQGQHVLTFAR